MMKKSKFFNELVILMYGYMCCNLVYAGLQYYDFDVLRHVELNYSKTCKENSKVLRYINRLIINVYFINVFSFLRNIITSFFFTYCIWFIRCMYSIQFGCIVRYIIVLMCNDIIIQVLMQVGWSDSNAYVENVGTVLLTFLFVKQFTLFV